MTNIANVPTHVLRSEICKREDEEWKRQDDLRVQEMLEFRDQLKERIPQTILVHRDPDANEYEVHVNKHFSEEWTKINNLRNIEFRRYRLLNVARYPIIDQMLQGVFHHMHEDGLLVLHKHNRFMMRVPEYFRKIEA